MICTHLLPAVVSFDLTPLRFVFVYSAQILVGALLLFFILQYVLLSFFWGESPILLTAFTCSAEVASLTTVQPVASPSCYAILLFAVLLRHTALRCLAALSCSLPSCFTLLHPCFSPETNIGVLPVSHSMPYIMSILTCWYSTLCACSVAYLCACFRLVVGVFLWCFWSLLIVSHLMLLCIAWICFYTDNEMIKWYWNDKMILKW
jgi:hypothetical protein